MEVVLNILCFRSGTDPELLTQILLSLTNLAVLPDWHHHLPPLLPSLLDNLTQSSFNNRSLDSVKYQSSRLLVNLTCNDDNIRHLLQSRCQTPIANIVSRCIPEDQLLRNVTFLSNVYCSAIRLGLVNMKDPRDVAPNTLLSGMVNAQNIILTEVQWMMDNHKNSDIRMQARKISVALS